MTAFRLIAATALAVTSGFAAKAQNVTFSTFIEPTHIIARHLHIPWAEAVREKTGGEIDIEIFTGGSLLPATGTLQGVTDGVAQAGHIAAAYYPSQLTLTNAVGDMGFTNPDPFVLAFSFADFVLHEAVAQADWERNGLVFGMNLSAPPHNYLCAGEVRTLDDLKGKKVRTPGGGWSRVAEALGMVPVNIASSEIYFALDTGAVDCVSADPSYLTSGSSIIELVDTVMMLPTTPSYTSAGIAFNQTYWQSLTDDRRRLMIEEAARAMVNLEVAYIDEVQAALDAATEQGVVLAEPDQAMQEAYDAWVANGVGGMAEIAKQNYGIEDPQALFSLYAEYIDKWSGLLEGADRTDAGALFALLKENALDSVDMASYGMN